MTEKTTLDADPAFAERLEWQLRTALRRRSRFARPVRGGPSHLARVAALVVGCVLFGAATVVAAERWQDRGQREFQAARARVRVELAESSLALLRADVERERLMFEQGIVSGGELLGLEQQFTAAETELALGRLDALEVERTGKAPRLDLAAPRVAGRDLVGERLRLALAGARARGESAGSAAERARLLYESGVVPVGELQEAQGELAAVEAGVALLSERLELRRRFLAREIDEQQALSGDLLIDARHRAARAADRAGGLGERIAVLRVQVEAGLTSRRALAGLELELRAAEAERELAGLEVELLEQELGAEADDR